MSEPQSALLLRKQLAGEFHLRNCNLIRCYKKNYFANRLIPTFFFFFLFVRRPLSLLSKSEKKRGEVTFFLLI